MGLQNLLAILAMVFSPGFSSVLADSTGLANATGADWFCGERGMETEYIKLTNKIDDYYFYWLVRSRSGNADSDPLVVWLNGGPGTSSLQGLLTENGPCLVQSDLSVKRNEYAWNNHANVIYLDQPSGVGYSYYTNDDDRDSTGEDVGKNMYAFLNSFTDKHPEFVGRPLFFTGQSYAGHYVPAAAHYLWSMNKQLEPSARRLNLQGMAIGNGAYDDSLQNKYASAMATHNNYNLTLLNATQITQMNTDADECATLYPTCIPFNDSAVGCYQISTTCEDAMTSPFVGAGRNAYDIRQSCTDQGECLSSGDDRVFRFVNSDVVSTALASVVQNITWNSFSYDVYNQFLGSGDSKRPYSPEVVDMLNDGLRVLIYAGDADLICNWIGIRAWTQSLQWKSTQGYNAAWEETFSVPVDPLGLTGGAEGKTTVAGSKWQFENLAFVRFGDAGHLVPKHQPLASVVLLERFLTNQPL